MSYSSYTPEFRAEAVRLVTELSRPVIDVARELRVNSETLRVWVNRAKRANVVVKSDSVAEKEAKELKRLQRKIADLEQENAFLKKAAAFFASEQNPRNGSR
jgi:transposase